MDEYILNIPKQEPNKSTTTTIFRLLTGMLTGMSCELVHIGKKKYKLKTTLTNQKLSCVHYREITGEYIRNCPSPEVNVNMKWGTLGY